MQLTTTYLDIWLTPSSTMTSNINYKDNLFKRNNLTTIRVEPTFKTLHKLRNEIKANAKSVYYNLGGWAHGYFGLVLTDTQYVLISPTPFVYLNHTGTLIIQDSTPAHTNFNMRITHTEKVRLLREVTSAKQDLLQRIFAMAKKAYLLDIHNRTDNSINNNVADVLNHLQDN